MKKKYVWGAIVLLAIIVGIAIWHYESKNSQLRQNATNGSEDVLQQNPDQQVPTPTPTPSSNSSGGAKAKLSYGEAVNTYKFRIQFSQCHGNPGFISLKINVPLMLDNKDNKTHSIKVAGQSFSIKAYDYALAYIPKAGTYNLTCDDGGSSTVNVEK